MTFASAISMNKVTNSTCILLSIFSEYHGQGVQLQHR